MVEYIILVNVGLIGVAILFLHLCVWGLGKWCDYWEERRVEEEEHTDA
jgi:hypothetical protein